MAATVATAPALATAAVLTVPNVLSLPPVPTAVSLPSPVNLVTSIRTPSPLNVPTSIRVPSPVSLPPSTRVPSPTSTTSTPSPAPVTTNMNPTPNSTGKNQDDDIDIALLDGRIKILKQTEPSQPKTPETPDEQNLSNLRELQSQLNSWSEDNKYNIDNEDRTVNYYRYYSTKSSTLTLTNNRINDVVEVLKQLEIGLLAEVEQYSVLVKYSPELKTRDIYLADLLAQIINYQKVLNPRIASEYAALEARRAKEEVERCKRLERQRQNEVNWRQYNYNKYYTKYYRGQTHSDHEGIDCVIL